MKNTILYKISIITYKINRQNHNRNDNIHYYRTLFKTPIFFTWTGNICYYCINYNSYYCAHNSLFYQLCFLLFSDLTMSEKIKPPTAPANITINNSSIILSYLILFSSQASHIIATIFNTLYSITLPIERGRNLAPKYVTITNIIGHVESPLFSPCTTSIIMI